MSPTWYDVLGVDRDATPDEVRTAWRRSIADLDPSDRADLEDLATSLVEPADHRSEWEGRWSKSFRALDALRSLINEFAAHDVLRWADGTPAGATGRFRRSPRCPCRGVVVRSVIGIPE